MQANEVPYAVLIFWVMAVVTITVFFLIRRVALRRRNTLAGYPYGYYRYRVKRLRRRYWYTLLTSVVLAVTVGVVWASSITS